MRCAEGGTREENIDLAVLVNYIKIDLFKKAKFVLGKDEWDVGGRIYNDFIKCCNGRIGLTTMSDVVRERYMETIWMKALTKNIQKKALVQKRTSIYTVMQNKFTGELHYGAQCCKVEEIVSHLLELFDANRFVCSLCREYMCLALN